MDIPQRKTPAYEALDIQLAGSITALFNRSGIDNIPAKEENKKWEPTEKSKKTIQSHRMRYRNFIWQKWNSRF